MPRNWRELRKSPREHNELPLLCLSDHSSASSKLRERWEHLQAQRCLDWRLYLDYTWRSTFMPGSPKLIEASRLCGRHPPLHRRIVCQQQAHTLRRIRQESLWAVQWYHRIVWWFYQKSASWPERTKGTTRISPSIYGLPRYERDRAAVRELPWPRWLLSFQ